jgi:hypothetical protein
MNQLSTYVLIVLILCVLIGLRQNAALNEPVKPLGPLPQLIHVKKPTYSELEDRVDSLTYRDMYGK